MADQYRVDLSELDSVVKKLNGVLKDVQDTKGKAKSETYLPPGALGSGFEEAEKLESAHVSMKGQIESIIDHLNDVMDDFGKKTVRTKSSYEESDYEVQAALSQKQS
ncbi:hypothetical protein [Streptomyces thermolineatus]|uniref:hypothetical protein n=1 Tax=Streptomyces thermolineatus TaxID=44033 RepID=UPI00384FB14C